MQKKNENLIGMVRLWIGIAVIMGAVDGVKKTVCINFANMNRLRRLSHESIQRQDKRREVGEGFLAFLFWPKPNLYR